MKKILFLLSFLLLIQSCKTTPKVANYTIKGKIVGYNQKEVTLSTFGKNLEKVTIAKSTIEDSIFSFTIPQQTPDLAIIDIKGRKKGIAIIIGDGNIDMDIDVYQPFKSNISRSNSPLTKKFFDYEINALKDKEDGMKIMQTYRTATTEEERNSIKESFEKWRDKAKKAQYDFIEQNKDIVGLIIIQSLIASPEADFQKIKMAFNQYPKQVRKLNLGKSINTTILSKGITEIGGQAPNFTGTTPDGKQLSLNQAMGKVTLIDFWASWCRPCRAENPYVVQIYDKYQNQGFRIIGVSLDKNKMSWEKAIKDDGLHWSHVSNLKFWQEPIAKLYGVMSIPQTFLLDKKGIIRAKNLRREQLEAKVKELLEE
jgi:thiol-disulfide isomerase/thioredoxin